MNYYLSCLNLETRQNVFKVAISWAKDESSWLMNNDESWMMIKLDWWRKSLDKEIFIDKESRFSFRKLFEWRFWGQTNREVAENPILTIKSVSSILFMFLMTTSHSTYIIRVKSIQKKLQIEVVCTRSKTQILGGLIC